MAKGLFVRFVAQPALGDLGTCPATDARPEQKRLFRRALLLLDGELFIASKRAVGDEVYACQIGKHTYKNHHKGPSATDCLKSLSKCKKPPHGGPF
ncbi:MAG: hypothetical protein WBG95_04810 [Sulfitobacter sp.]